MYYAEMSIEDAIKKCKKHATVLVAIQNLEDEENVDIIFVKKRKNEYDQVFENVKTVASLCDDFIQQLKLFTEKQDIYNIRSNGFLKTVMLKE
jgi:hypothetical protein